MIIGSIYFVYFYTQPIEKDGLKELNKESVINSQNENLEFPDEEVSKNSKKKKINKEGVKINSNKDNSKKIDNLTKAIEYSTINNNGDSFKILAKYGKTNIKNTNILDLEKVNGIIKLKKGSKVLISSDFAEYNYNNQNSKFYSNVEIKYDTKLITCDNLKIILEDNLAIAYDNVLVVDDKSIMKADTITMDIITKDININSKDNIKILEN